MNSSLTFILFQIALTVVNSSGTMSKCGWYSFRRSCQNGKLNYRLKLN